MTDDITNLYIPELKLHRRILLDLHGEIREKFFYSLVLFYKPGLKGKALAKDIL